MQRYVWYQDELAEVEIVRGDSVTIRLVRENISFVVARCELEPVAQADLEALADEYEIEL